MMVEVRLKKADCVNGFGFRIRHGGGREAPIIADITPDGPTDGLVN